MLITSTKPQWVIQTLIINQQHIYNTGLNMSDRTAVRDPLILIPKENIELFTERFESRHLKCPICGDFLLIEFQGFIPEAKFPELARAITYCRTCKIESVC